MKMTREEAIKELKIQFVGEYDRQREAKEMAIKALEQESKWISVSERLPETDTDVLVTNGIGTYIGWIDPTDKCWRVDSESEYFMNDIVAWMHLPEPYKKSEEV